MCRCASAYAAEVAEALVGSAAAGAAWGAAAHLVQVGARTCARGGGALVSVRGCKVCVYARARVFVSAHVAGVG